MKTLFILISFLFTVPAILVIGYFAIGASFRLQREANTSTKAIEERWSIGDYKAVYDTCIEPLERRPDDTTYLLYAGYSAFFLGLAELDEEPRLVWMDAAVTRIRKAMALNASIAGQAEYVLGKAYYYKGWYFYDSSAACLENAEAHGFAAADMDEYLAVIFAALGDTAKSLGRFEKALSVSRSDLLLLAAARAFLDAGNDSKAEALAIEAKTGTFDAVIREQARFLLAGIYRAKKDSARAERELTEALGENPDASEAHYLLGMLYSDQGDSVRARSEWRKTLAIDPTHAAARQKLNDR
ncbi:MAG: tetratricopeptide repeat protein [Spirochaetes bacterium]|nr:tetratricopeptide repeat protein [Spirochaetota bacterium]